MTEKEVLEIIEKAAREGSTELRLSYKGLKSLPGKIGELTNLKKLYLEANQLTSVPAELGQLEKLEHLDLQNNQLTSILTRIN
jgi:Leucine-rich repeat (LRR) protein